MQKEETLHREGVEALEQVVQKHSGFPIPGCAQDETGWSSAPWCSARCLCPSQGAGLDDHKRSLSTQTMLGF